MEIHGDAISGDMLILSPLENASKGFHFLINKPEEIAAASEILVSADTKNEGLAVLDVKKTKVKKTDDITKIDKIFANSNSPILAKEIITEGVISVIPPEINKLNLTSFATQSKAPFSL